jgi:hypothetical protein
MFREFSRFALLASATKALSSSAQLWNVPVPSSAPLPVISVCLPFSLSFSDLHDKRMANVVDGRRTYIAAIYIARTTPTSIIYTRRHSNQIALAIRPIYKHITVAVVVVGAIDTTVVGIS